MIRPTVLDVANLMPDRTTLRGGASAGTFTADTTPTDTQVDAIIDMVLDTIDQRIWDLVNAREATPREERSARTIVTLSAAILTEVTYFSHQGDVSEVRIGVWERMIAAYTLALFGEEGDATLEPEDVVPGVPIGLASGMRGRWGWEGTD